MGVAVPVALSLLLQLCRADSNQKPLHICMLKQASTSVRLLLTASYCQLLTASYCQLLPEQGERGNKTKDQGERGDKEARARGTKSKEKEARISQLQLVLPVTNYQVLRSITCASLTCKFVFVFSTQLLAASHCRLLTASSPPLPSSVKLCQRLRT